MRKVTAKCLESFVASNPCKVGNDEITVNASTGAVYWKLHGNVIAILQKRNATGQLYLTTCGWNSATTWDRLNSISRALHVNFKRQESMKHNPRFLQQNTFNI